MDSKNNTIVDLYGLSTEANYCTCVEDCHHSHGPITTRTRLATFSSLELAEEYVKASTLKSYKGYISGARFRAVSLLRYCDDYEIESHDDLSVPHDPVL